MIVTFMFLIQLHMKRHLQGIFIFLQLTGVYLSSFTFLLTLTFYKVACI